MIPLWGKCPWCHRAASTCWTMPCLELSRALGNANDCSDPECTECAGFPPRDDLMLVWAFWTGTGIESRGRVICPPLHAAMQAGGA